MDNQRISKRALSTLKCLKFETDMIFLLTCKEAREYNRHEVRMTRNPTQRRKEVTALDADVPLLRPSLIRMNVSESRKFKPEADRLQARHLCGFGAV
jgi:hypothetical protein